MERLLLVKGQWEALAETAHYDANELARLCGISIRQLQRHFRAHFHGSPQSWLNERRLLAAQALLRSGELVKKSRSIRASKAQSVGTSSTVTIKQGSWGYYWQLD